MIYLFIIRRCAFTAQERQKNRCAVFTEQQYVQWGSEVQITCRCSVSYGKTFWTVNNQQADDHLSDSINSSHGVLSLKNFTYKSAVIQCHSSTGIVFDGTTIKTYSKSIRFFFHAMYAYGAYNFSRSKVLGHFLTTSANPNSKTQQRVLSLLATRSAIGSLPKHGLPLGA